MLVLIVLQFINYSAKGTELLLRVVEEIDTDNNDTSCFLKVHFSTETLLTASGYLGIITFHRRSW